jgi:hypothetical protein
MRVMKSGMMRCVWCKKNVMRVMKSGMMKRVWCKKNVNRILVKKHEPRTHLGHLVAFGTIIPECVMQKCDV